MRLELSGVGRFDLGERSYSRSAESDPPHQAEVAKRVRFADGSETTNAPGTKSDG